MTRGFEPSIDNGDERVPLLEAIGKAGYKAGEQMFLALDVAASEFFDKKTSVYNYEGKPRSSQDMVDLYAGWVAKYPLVSIEDGLAEDDWDGWKLLTDKLGTKTQLVVTIWSHPRPPRARTSRASRTRSSSR